MLSRFPAVTRCLSIAALCAAGPVSALELPLPPPGEDIVGQVQVIKAKYEDTFADLGTTYDLGYSEMVAANPGVDAWLPGQAPISSCRPASSCRPGRAKAS
ncbi:hypothetical protein PHLH7_16060 [Pseudomonas sp. Ost2]|nr:hypothetical protein PHLH7_16060 [Pseudomonas sp. Ost2]